MAPAVSTEMIVQQVLQAVPLYNPVIAGMPFYLIIIIFLFFGLLFTVLAVWQYVYEPLKPVWGFRTASIHNKPQSIIHGMNGQIWLEATDYVAGLFRSMNLPLMWIITAPVSGQMGKVSTLEMSDDWNIVHNIDIDYAIVEIVHRYNENQKQLHPEMKADELAQQDLVIYDWKSLEKRLLNGELDSFIPNGVKLPPFRIVDLHEVRRYLPKWTAAHFAGYINQEVAKRQTKDENAGKQMMTYALIAGGIIIISAVFAYLILQMSGAK